LKINKTLIKGKRTKINNQNLKDWIWNTKNNDNHSAFLGVRERKKEEKKATNNRKLPCIIQKEKGDDKE
jgi:hypothetical protein